MAETRAVIFDAVGTLIFPFEPVSRTYARVATRHGAIVTEPQVLRAFREAYAKQEVVDQEAGWRTDENRECERWQTIVAALFPNGNAGPCFEELWAYFATPAAWRVHEEASEVLNELSRRGLIVGIASNFDARLFEIVEAFAELAPLRNHCIISSGVGWRKPAPAFFDAVAARIGCSHGAILVVGDDLRNDFEGATAAGMQAVLFEPEGSSTILPRIERLRDILAL